MKLIQKIRKLQSNLRYKKAKKFILGKSIDVGCEWRRSFFDVCCDLNPKNSNVEKQNILNLTYQDSSFDTVVCMEVLEHVLDPVKAIKELKRIAKKRIVICVPLEPYFTLPRLFLGWNKEHLFAITPKLLEHYLGRPIYKKWFLFRWYFAVFEK